MCSTISSRYFHTFGEQHEVFLCLDGRVEGAGVDGLEGGLEGPPHRELTAVLDKRVVEEIGELPGGYVWTRDTNERWDEREKQGIKSAKAGGRQERERERECATCSPW